IPNSATPTTRMMMPSLFSQFVPSVSSSAETVLTRCANVCFGARCRNGSTVDGAAIRAAAGSFTVSFAAYAGTDGGGAGVWDGGSFASSGIFGGSAGTTGGGTGFGGEVAATGGGSAGFK